MARHNLFIDHSLVDYSHRIMLTSFSNLLDINTSAVTVWRTAHARVTSVKSKNLKLRRTLGSFRLPPFCYSRGLRVRHHVVWVNVYWFLFSLCSAQLRYFIRELFYFPPKVLIRYVIAVLRTHIVPLSFTYNVFFLSCVLSDRPNSSFILCPGQM